MDVKELLDDETQDPKKYFDKEKYNTLTISLNNDEGITFKDSDIDIVIELLDENISREEREDKLKQVKENKLNDLLIKAVKQAETNEDRAKLLSICWESGLDFKDEFLFFVEQALSDDYMVSLEAYTVAVTIEELNDEAVLTKAILMIDNSNTANLQTKEDLKSFILSKLK